MSKDDEQCLKLGREVVRMIRDLKKVVAGKDTGFARQEVTFPGGSVHLFVVNDEELAETLERAAAGGYDVQEAVPPSKAN